MDDTRPKLLRKCRNQLASNWFREIPLRVPGSESVFREIAAKTIHDRFTDYAGQQKDRPLDEAGLFVVLRVCFPELKVLGLPLLLSPRFHPLRAVRRRNITEPAFRQAGDPDRRFLTAYAPEQRPQGGDELGVLRLRRYVQGMVRVDHLAVESDAPVLRQCLWHRVHIDLYRIANSEKW